MAQGEKEKRRRDDQGKKVSGINAGETRPPEISRTQFRTVVGIDQNEAGKNKEEVNADVSDAGEVLIPPGTAGQNTDHSHVKQDDKKRREETQRGYGVK